MNSEPEPTERSWSCDEPQPDDPLHLKWFLNDGGPYAVVPRESICYWEGADPPTGGRIVEAECRTSCCDEATDYDRAGDVTDIAGLIEVGPGWGLVFAGCGEANAAWLPVGGKDIVVVGTLGWTSRGDFVHGVYVGLTASRWEVVHPAVEITCTELALFHGVVHGSKAQVPDSKLCYLDYCTDTSLCRIEPGRYVIETAAVRVEEKADLQFCRLRRIEAGTKDVIERVSQPDLFPVDEK